MNFTNEEIIELRSMVKDWISEGFTTPPYSPVQYAIFAKLITEDVAVTEAITERSRDGQHQEAESHD